MKALSVNNEIVRSKIKFYSDQLRNEFRKKKELRNPEAIKKWKEKRDRLTKW